MSQIDEASIARQIGKNLAAITASKKPAGKASSPAADQQPVMIADLSGEEITAWLRAGVQSRWADEDEPQRDNEPPTLQRALSLYPESDRDAARGYLVLMGRLPRTEAEIDFGRHVAHRTKDRSPQDQAANHRRAEAALARLIESSPK